MALKGLENNTATSRGWIAKNLHLLFSTFIVIPTALIYGTPAILNQHLDIEVTTVDQANMLKAVMCLYLGVSAVWITGMFKGNYWVDATKLNILFMLTLATGRILSMSVDGLPTGGYIFGVIAEVVLGLYSVYQLQRCGKLKDYGAAS